MMNWSNYIHIWTLKLGVGVSEFESEAESIKQLYKEAEKKFFLRFYELSLQNKHLKMELNDILSKIQLANQNLNTFTVLLQQEQKKLEQKCIISIFVVSEIQLLELTSEILFFSGNDLKALSNEKSNQDFQTDSNTETKLLDYTKQIEAKSELFREEEFDYIFFLYFYNLMI